MTNSINIKDFTVSMKAQGIVKTVKLADFHADALDAILTYGTRRWFQDNLNAVAKGLRDNGEKVDAEDIFDARLQQAITGDITTRTATETDPRDEYRYKVMRAYMPTKGDVKAGKASANQVELYTTYTAIDSTDAKARKDFLLSVAHANPDWAEPRVDAMMQAEADLLADDDIDFKVA